MRDENEELQPYNLPKEESSSTFNLVKPQSKSNQQYIVPLGIVIVLFTLYLSTSAFKRTQDLNEPKLIKEADQQLQDSENAKDLLKEQKTNEHESKDRILMKLLEHNDKCYDLQIFTKDITSITDYDFTDNISTEDEHSADESIEEVVRYKNLLLTTSKVIVKNGKTSKTLKRINGRHGNNNFKNNKSVKAKILRKKEALRVSKDTQPKKGSTAEPIIYLFALVFIYLLLKAASDINQHYKSQSKGDKRLRRCSLQSYAQTHKTDRRASKESPIKVKHLMTMEIRSQSVDRYTSDAEIVRKNEMLSKLRRYTSVDESQKQRKPATPTWSYITANSSPTKTPTPLAIDQCIENMVARALVLNRQDSIPTLLTHASSSSASSSPNRRCSVPISLNYQRLKLSTTPSVTIASTTRRTSITAGNVGVGCLDSSIDLKFPEVKRRVRMINRH